MTRRGGAEWDGRVDQSEVARTPHSCRGGVAAVVFIIVVVLGGGVVAGVAVLPPIIVEDMQLAVLAAHVLTTMRRLANAKLGGQATVSGGSRCSARADNNQPKSGNKDVQSITWSM